MNFHAAALGAELASAAGAVLLARRRPDHRPAAVALILLTVAAVTELPILAALRPLPRPIEGDARWLVYVDGALVLAMGAIVPGLALAVSLDRPRRAVAGVVVVWALASIALAAAYPSPMVRGPGLARLYLDADLAGLFVTFAALGRWVGLKRWPTPAHVTAGALAFVDIAILLVPFSPWRDGLFGRFEGVQLMLFLLFTIMTIVQVILWRFSPTR